MCIIRQKEQGEQGKHGKQGEERERIIITFKKYTNKFVYLLISEFFNSGGRLVNHFVPGDVTVIESLPDRYGIAYEAVTTKGMSGNPVINLAGEVVAVHGLSHVEVTRLAEIKGVPKPQLQALEEIVKRSKNKYF